MPYTTERGVTSYSDRDTPSEYATGADEEQAAFNEAQDAVFTEVERLLVTIGMLYGNPGDVVAGRLALESFAVRLAKINLEAAKLL